MLKLYFSQTAGLFSLAVQIEDDDDHSLVFHKVYPPHTVAQFSDHAIYNPDELLKDYALTISNLNYKSKNLSINLQFSGPLTEKTPPAPSCFLEFYGKIEDQLEGQAAIAHQETISERQSKKAPKMEESTFGQSLKFYTYKLEN